MKNWRNIKATLDATNMERFEDAVLAATDIQKGKELMIVEPVIPKRQYGGRTLVEKVTALKLYGEIYFDVREVDRAKKTVKSCLAWRHI